MKNLTRLEAIAELTAVGQDYELETIEMYGRTVRGFKNGPATLREHFEVACSDETFLVYDNERYSFTEAHEKAGLFAAVLQQEYGIEKGDRVAISMRNYPEWVLSFMAITSMGAIAVAMNSLWTPDEMAYGLKDSGAKVLFADQERIDRIQPIMAELDLNIIAVRPTAVLAENITSIDDLMTKYAGQTMPDVDVSPHDNATILYTSGSTGHPKGAVSCHQNIMTALLSWELDQHIALVINNLTLPEAEYQASTLLAVPLFHATGLLAGLLSSYRIQRKVVLMYKWDADLSTEIIEEERITSFIAPAAMTGDLVEKAKSTNRDLSSLATVGGGGAPRAPEQVRSIASSFAKAMPNTGWGMTETNAIGAGIGGEDYLEHPSSSGRCSAALDIKVINEAGETLPAGERGELLICGSSVIKGYWNRPDANAETFVDGWLKTGDVAYIDQEGYLYIVDRIKDLVIRGGENIGCAEVEAGLLVHPQVLEASVYAVPDERLGEEVGATIYTDGEIDGEVLKKFLLDHIARFKIPRYIVVSEEPLLRIASGKIDKRRIRELAVEQLLG